MRVAERLNVTSGPSSDDPTRKLPENGNLASDSDTSIAVACGSVGLVMGVYFAFFAPRARFEQTEVSPLNHCAASPFLQPGSSEAHGPSTPAFSQTETPNSDRPAHMSVGVNGDPESIRLHGAGSERETRSHAPGGGTTSDSCTPRFSDRGAR